MEFVTGALPSAITKLGDLLVGEYNLQKALKGEIRFLQAELESMQGALQKVSNTPAHQLDIQDKIWSRDLRELSYDIEDSIDTFMVRGKGNESVVKLHGINKFVDRSVDLFRKARIRHGIAIEIRDIKRRVVEVNERRHRYEVSLGVDKPVMATVDPRLLAQYTMVTNLVGVDEARYELIKILTEGDEVSMQQGKIVSIVGFGGLGKTTLANAVYQKIRAEFDCCAFVSVSQTPDLKRLFKGILFQFDKKQYGNINEKPLDEGQLTSELVQYLEKKRYFIVIDDIWDISVWKMIKCALPDNNVANKILITTRILNVAEQAGGAYKMKPLSPNNSQKLLYRRVFGNEKKDINEDAEKCPDGELVKVSERILKKCAGVPLAINTMASLLACKRRNKMGWYEVYNSMGTGLENNLDVENMRKILSFSYYELPLHLRTCLLYLSMFPEDFEIDRSRLIWMWIAEGFIQCEKQGQSLFDLGESYFIELINRNMIQPVYMGHYDTVYGCRVHDMVLDLISSLAREENFVTVLDGMNRTSPSKTIRRLSVQNVMENHVTDQAMSLQQARSVNVFPSDRVPVPDLGSSRVLRVLELKDCNRSLSNNLKYLGNLRHLRYLGLKWTSISQLPEEIGSMQFLQILDLWGTVISCLPSTIVQLRNLMCLHLAWRTRAPNGIGNLKCLEQLLMLHIDDSTINILEELGELTELRALSIRLDKWDDRLLECVQKLQKINDLAIMAAIPHCRRSIGGLDAWVAPRNLRALDTRQSCWFSTLPAWVNPSLLLDLTTLSIAVSCLQQVDLEILGSLSALRCLELEVNHENHKTLGRFAVGAGLFQCLRQCRFEGFVGPVVFQQGAMPCLRELWLDCLYVQEEKEFISSDGDLDLGLGNLPSLQNIYVIHQRDGVSKKDAEQAKVVLRRAAEIHPNHPVLKIF